jgi:hypothetical protein
MVRGIPTAHSAEPLKSLFVKKPINGQWGKFRHRKLCFELLLSK